LHWLTSIETGVMVRTGAEMLFQESEDIENIRTFINVSSK
jgi:hypothetical protein